MTVRILFSFKYIFGMRIDHLAFSLPKPRSTEFLELLSKLLKKTFALLEYVSNSFIQNGVRG